MSKEEISDLGVDPRIYEVGFLLVPSISEDNVEKEAQNIRKIVDGIGCKHISDGKPNKIDLAYKMSYTGGTTGREKSVFETAYFGWLKFEVNPESIIELKVKMEQNVNVLRFIIIKTVREDTKIVERPRSVMG